MNLKKNRRLFLSVIPKDFDPKKDIAIGPRSLIGMEDLYPNWQDFNFVDVFSDRFFRKKEALLASQIANKKLCELAQEMNNNHNINKSVGFWQIILMPWLFNFTMVSLKRYREVQYLVTQNKEQELHVEIFDKNRDWQLIDDSSLWQRALRNPVFDYWLTSQFVKLMAPRNWKTSSVSVPITDYSEKNKSYLSNAPQKTRLRLPVDRLPGMRLHHQFLLSFYCLLISPFHRRKNVPEVHDRTRKTVVDISPSFYSVYNMVLRSCMPLSLRNHFHNYNTNAQKIRYHSGRLYLSSSGLLHHSIEKRFEAAHAFENGERLVLAQHGAGYGIWDYFFASEIEYKHHAFLSWGWKKHSGHTVRAVPTKSPLISEFLNKQVVKKREGIILVGTRMSISCNRFNSEAEPLELLRYRQMKLDLYSKLAKEIKGNFKYRPYPFEIADLDDEKFFEKYAPQVPIVRGDLEPQVHSSKLIIIDYPGTLLHIMMASSTPIIALWDKNSWPISKSAEEQFDCLRIAGILHHNTESAVAHINKIWPNPNEWWQNPSTLKMRKAWSDKHGQHSKFWLFFWLKSLWKVNLMPKIIKNENKIF